MNALVSLTNNVMHAERAAVTPQLMAICRAVTPQFYKTMSDVEVKAEKASIELLTANIDNLTLARMCELAVLNYPKARSENNKTYFDINFILTFFNQAFNYVWCESVEVPRGSERTKSSFRHDMNILEETYEDKAGGTYHVKCIYEPKGTPHEHYYSPKFWQLFSQNIDEVEL